MMMMMIRMAMTARRALLLTGWSLVSFRPKRMFCDWRLVTLFFVVLVPRTTPALFDGHYSVFFRPHIIGLWNGDTSSIEPAWTGGPPTPAVVARTLADALPLALDDKDDNAVDE